MATPGHGSVPVKDSMLLKMRTLVPVDTYLMQNDSHGGGLTMVNYCRGGPFVTMLAVMEESSDRISTRHYISLERSFSS